MSKQTALELLKHGLKVYGEVEIAGENIDKLVEKHSVINEKVIQGISLRRLMEALIIAGDILEENLEQSYYITSIPTGLLKAARALVAVVLENDTLYFAAFAKEGLIKQNLAQAAIDTIVTIMEKR